MLTLSVSNALSAVNPVGEAGTARVLRGDFILVLAGGVTVTSSERFRARVKEHLTSLRIAPS